MTTNLFVPPAAEGLPLGALDSATEGANALDAWAKDPRGRNFLAHALVQLARDGWLRSEPGDGFEPVRDRETTPEPEAAAAVSSPSAARADDRTAEAVCVCGHPMRLHHEDVCLLTGCGCADGREPENTDLAARLEAVLTEKFTELGNPFSRMRIAFQGPDGWPASKEVGPHDVALVLRELLAEERDEAQAQANLDALADLLPPPADRAAEIERLTAELEHSRIAWNSLARCIREDGAALVEVGHLVGLSLGERTVSVRTAIEAIGTVLRRMADEAAAPAPADRAALLLWAADQIDAETRQAKAHGVLEPDKYRPCRDASAQLRALAGCQECASGLEHDTHCPTPESHNWGCGCPSDVAAAIASCPGYEMAGPSPCRCPCYGCKHHCAAHDPRRLADEPQQPDAAPLAEMRAAVLREAADIADRLPTADQYQHHSQLSDAWDDGTRAVAAKLRRIADALPAAPVPAPADRPAVLREVFDALRSGQVAYDPDALQAALSGGGAAGVAVYVQTVVGEFVRGMAVEARQQPDTETELPFIHVDDDGDQLDIGAVMASTYDGEAPVVYVAANQHQGDQVATVYVRPERVEQVVTALRAARQAAEALPATVPGPGGVADEEQPTEVVHACPPDGSGLTPCCGRTPFELPLGDRISSEAPVTCSGAVVSQPGKEV